MGGTFVDISAGEDRTCGVRTGGELVCWGDEFGKPPGGRFVKVDVWDQRGAGNACAVGAGGALRCWSRFRTGRDREVFGHDNDFGQADPPGGVFVDVSVGERYACALRADGSAVCWGDNLGQSYGTAGQFERWPKGALAVPEGPFSQVHASMPPCGLRTSGEAACWSDQGRALMSEWARGDDGVFFDERWTLISTGWGYQPIDFRGPETPLMVCGIRADATMDCHSDRLGFSDGRYAGSYGSSGLHLLADDPDWLDRHGGFAAVDYGSDPVCALLADRTITCSGTRRFREYNVYGWHDAVIDPPDGEFVQVAVGRVHACAIRTDGTVACWGNNSDRPVKCCPDIWLDSAYRGDPRMDAALPVLLARVLPPEQRQVA
ncbi:RCC1 domain-containing protein [Candidatus Poriferisodalis sp.]|uniref:RCC1 domain-containing protein n=1 Tax=Candidatus Poriferisodalis sp. TaxID=3101277 RepID=UPI003B01FD0A